MQWDAHQQIGGGEPECRAAPAERIDQPLRDRNEHRAGEPAGEREHNDPLAIRVAEAAFDNGECRFVQRGGHHQSESGPDQIKTQQRMIDREQCEQRDGQHRSSSHRGATAMAVDPDPGRHQDQRGDPQRHRIRTGQHALRPAELRLHRDQHDPERVIDSAPGDDLRRRQRPDQSPRQCRVRVQDVNRAGLSIGSCYGPGNAVAITMEASVGCASAVRRHHND